MTLEQQHHFINCLAAPMDWRYVTAQLS